MWEFIRDELHSRSLRNKRNNQWEGASGAALLLALAWPADS
jgi:hypothetical protein